MDDEASITWIADFALTPSGWAPDVRLQVGSNGRFTAVELGDSGCAATPQREIRLKGAVLPALSNLHSHAFQRGLVGRTEQAGVRPKNSSPQDDFWSWRHAMYEFLGRLDPDAIEDVATLVYCEMVRAGYGSVAEFHYVHHALAGARYDDPFELSRRLVRSAQKAGIRLTLVPVVYESGGFGGLPLSGAQRRFARSADEVIRTVEALGDRTASTNQDTTLAFGVGLHSLRAAGPDALDAISAWAEDRGDVPVHLHIAEQPAEIEACIEWSGARPVEWLLDHAAVGPRWCLVHATHMVDTERTRLAKTGAVAVLCPTTEANLGDGVFELEQYEAAGGSWGVGSDSQISVCPADELRTLEYGQRLTKGSRVIAGRSSPHGFSNGRAMVESCLESASRATGQRVGRLEAGACADLVVIDPDHPRLLGLEGDALLDAWIFGSGPEVVTDVMVAGRWSVRDGVHANWEAAVEGYRRVSLGLGGT